MCLNLKHVVAGLFAAAVSIAAAAAPAASWPQVFESAHNSARTPEKTLSPAESAFRLMEFSLYADLSEAVYRRDFPSPQERMLKGCDYVSSGDVSHLLVGLPLGWRKLDQKLIAQLAQKTKDADAGSLKPCRSLAGLNYETYIRLDQSGQLAEAVIAFRGTENTKYQWKNDWLTNFRNVDFGLGENKAFTEARVEVGRLIRILAQHLPAGRPNTACEKVMADRKSAGYAPVVQAPISLVGHSLGGGLAQHLAFASEPCEVMKTVTFDSSPATGWFYLAQRKMVRTADPVIQRVYLDGEALSFVRKVSTKFTQTRENRTDFRIKLPGVSGNAFGLHSMTLLAASIKAGAALAMPDDPALIVNYDLKQATAGPN